MPTGATIIKTTYVMFLLVANTKIDCSLQKTVEDIHRETWCKA